MGLILTIKLWKGPFFRIFPKVNALKKFHLSKHRRKSISRVFKTFKCSLFAMLTIVDWLIKKPNVFLNALPRKA